MRLKEQLLVGAAAYCAATGLSEARLSMKLFGSGKRLRQLREGADTASRRVEDTLQWLSNHWPEGAVWPEGVTRPAPAPPPEANAQA